MSTFTINGVELYYEVTGDLASKEAIVFLNGVMASTTSWVYQVELFKKLGYKILLHDRSEERRVGKECRYRW